LSVAASCPNLRSGNTFLSISLHEAFISNSIYIFNPVVMSSICVSSLFDVIGLAEHQSEGIAG
jgi:hypothetical protein